MSDRYMNERACGIEPECEGEEPTLEQWRTSCRELWRLTHPEAQGNKDLGEPAASGLEEKEPLLATRPDGSKTLTQAGVDMVDKACRASSEFLYEIPVGELEITAEMAGAAHTYHYRPASHLETPIDHWKGVIRAALLQARSAAPTSPQPIKGDKTEALTDAATLQGLEGL